MSNPEHRGRRNSGFHTSWQRLGGVASADLEPARGVLQKAVAEVAEASRRAGSEGEAPGGALEWLEDHHALVGPVLEGTGGVRVALRPGEMTLLMLGADEAVLKTQPLESCTVQDVRTWLARELGAVGARAGSADSEPPPSASLGCPDREALAEIDRWMCNGDHVLRGIARASANASAVRCDPAEPALHAELAHPTREGETARVVSVGMSLGGGADPAPHFFVRVSPVSRAPEGTDPSWALRGDEAEARLPASVVVGHRGSEAQAAAVEAFFERAIPAAHALVHREWRRR